MLTEVIGGYLAGSVAVVTDAAHLLSDLVGFLVSIFAIWLGQLPPTKRLSFGYYRAEVLGALLSVAIIWMLTGIFIYVAILRLLRSDFEIDANTMMLVSGLGVLINIIMGLTLHGACNHLPHGHSHGGIQSSCKSSQESAHTPGNINIRAATVHVLGDLVQSVGVFVAAIIIKCYPNAKMADPICTFVFSLLMLLTTLSVLRDTLNVLMEGFPKHLDYAVILNTLSSIDGVENVHNLHVWCLTLDKCALAVHLAISDSVDAAVVLRNALKLVRSKLKIDVITVQIEKYLAPAMDDCQQCKPLVD
ncbi:zinc transporter 2 [Cephus cinctus]|uniref:Zinc transporter 2 n=1 Tax=Cephus cinctus TaxID=211228 RepID=A0AAJ7W4W3_CEPCN|nr:zinc transporter 2 [Cephus cinctus]XP_024944512.1 zinc transporter 2 [Cephus cinctus]